MKKLNEAVICIKIKNHEERLEFDNSSAYVKVKFAEGLTEEEIIKEVKDTISGFELYDAGFDDSDEDLNVHAVYVDSYGNCPDAVIRYLEEVVGWEIEDFPILEFTMD